MSTTVHEALQNAQINFENLGRSPLGKHPFFLIAKSQLDNALEAIDNGTALNDVIQESMGDDVKTTSGERP